MRAFLNLAYVEYRVTHKNEPSKGGENGKKSNDLKIPSFDNNVHISSLQHLSLIIIFTVPLRTFFPSDLVMSEQVYNYVTSNVYLIGGVFLSYVV